MSTPLASTGVMPGMVSQAGGRPPQAGNPTNRAGGLIVPGCVVATYLQLDGVEAFDDKVTNRPVAVYCDVLTYGTRPGALGSFIRRALVAQSTGMHSGTIWKPRAATMDVVKKTPSAAGPAGLNPDTADPRNLDGDHVMVQFLEDNLQKPVITGRLPHPLTGLGNEEEESVGQRMLFKLTDGDPTFWKHNGSYFGIDRDGSFVTDTSQAHEGKYDEDGTEIPITTGGGQIIRWKNGQSLKLVSQGTDGTTVTVLCELKDGEISMRLDDSDAEVSIKDARISLKLGANATLDLTPSHALKLGSGADNVVRWSTLLSWWQTIKAYIDDKINLLTVHANGHAHPFVNGTPGSTGNTSPSSAQVVAAPGLPVLATNTKSTKLTIPSE